MAIESLGPGECWKERWLCRCDCGNEVQVFKTHLLQGHTTSCGCIRRERAREQMRKRHGKATVGHTQDK